MSHSWVTSLQFSSVQFTMVLYAWQSPCAFHSLCKRFPQHCLWNSSNVCLLDDSLFSSFQQIVECLLFPRLSPPGNQCCDVLGFVPTGSVSSSSILLSQAPQCLLDDSLFSSFQQIVECLLFPRLSPPGNQCCDVLGFVPTGSVSSSSILKAFHDGSHLWLLLHQHVQYICMNLWRWITDCRALTHANLSFPFHFLYHAQSISEDDSMVLEPS